MKLSDRNKTIGEILGWKKKIVKCSCVDVFTPNPEDIPCRCGARENLIFNTALTSCDREIDREALAKNIFDIELENPHLTYEQRAGKIAEYLISTMPTWLKRTEK